MTDYRLQQLEGFYLVARHGGYTKAAQAYPYPIGQPAVYQQVKGLQDTLGVALVRQVGPRRTELTPEGRTLYEFLTPFFEGLPRVIEGLRGEAGGPLILAADQFLAMEALPAALVRMREQRPAFRVRVEELATPEIEARIRNGQVDAGLVHVLRTPAGLAWEPLGHIGAALLVPEGHPLAKLGRPPTTAELVRHPLIAYEPQSPGRLLLERIFREAGSRLTIAAEVTFSQTMRALARAGVAPAFVPFLRRAKGAVELPREPGTVAFDASARIQGGALPFGLLYRPGLEESPSFRALAAALREAAGPA
ncbi:MAG: LysR family transcriptional regulator [Planctomycetota bacterium]|nr:LysR family transcriptional regulator [Planctomycetota bacterium]